MVAALLCLAAAAASLPGVPAYLPAGQIMPWARSASSARGILDRQLLGKQVLPLPPSRSSPPSRTWVAQLQFYNAKDLKINFKNPKAQGNYGSVFFGELRDGTQVVVKCPVLEEFSLKLFDTERAVNIKLSQQTGALSVPWATMLGEVNIPEPQPIAPDLARVGIVFRKEGMGRTLEEYLATNKDLYGVLKCREAPLQASKGLLRPELCRNVMGQLLIGTLQMQEKGVMHRDIKPSNTVVVPDDPQHQIKIIDFGSSCDWGSLDKRGLGDATCDPMYAPPEQKLQLLNPGKFDVFSVGMIGFRVLFPSLTRGGVSYEWPGGYFQQFAEEYLPEYAWNIERWIEDCAASNIGQISEECKEALDDPQVAELMKLLYKMLDKDTFRRVSVQQAINELGPEWQARCLQEQKIKKETEAQQKALEEANRREEATRTEQVKKELQLREKEEAARRKAAEDAAIRASKAEEQRLRQLLLSGDNKERSMALGTVRKQRGKWGSAQAQARQSVGNFFGNMFGKRQGPPVADTEQAGMPASIELGDDDIANIVPEAWKEGGRGSQFYRNADFTFRVGEIVVAFRSDGSRRYGRILQDNGDATYDILVDRFGGEGAGQYRTDSAGNIGKIATTGSLSEELAANAAASENDKRFRRSQEMVAGVVGDLAPEGWRESEDFNFSPTSSFKNGEMVVVARSDGQITWAKVQTFGKEGLYEVLVEAGAKKTFFPASIGKVLA